MTEALTPALAVASAGFLGTHDVKDSIERMAMGVIDLDTYAYRKGPHRLKKRLAKKVVAWFAKQPFPSLDRPWSGRYPQAMVVAALKTLRRPKNRAARREWGGLSDAEREQRRATAMISLAMPIGSIAAAAFLTGRFGRKAS